MAYFHQELEAWTTDFALPTTVWLAGFFNPQSFLTAIMQSMARKNEWPLDKMCLSVEVTKKNREDMTAPPREGAYVYGLFMEGARWDTQTGVIAEARLKELTPAMPVVFIKAIPVRPQKKFLISGVTIFTHSFTCRLGCSKVADDTTPEHR